MNQIENALDELVKSIKESTEYNRYQDIRARVHEYPELESQIHEFRRKNYELQNSVANWDMFEQVEKLNRDYSQFRKNPLVSEYLSAELAFCRMLQNINWTIIRSIDFEVGFVNE